MSDEVSKELNEIKRGQDALNLNLAHYMKSVDEKLDRQDKRTTRLSYELYGGENSDQPGIKVQTDRLVQAEKTRLEKEKNLAAQIWSIFVAIVVLALTALWNFFTQHPSPPKP